MGQWSEHQTEGLGTQVCCVYDLNEEQISTPWGLIFLLMSQEANAYGTFESTLYSE